MTADDLKHLTRVQALHRGASARKVVAAGCQQLLDCAEQIDVEVRAVCSLLRAAACPLGSTPTRPLPPAPHPSPFPTWQLILPSPSHHLPHITRAMRQVYTEFVSKRRQQRRIQQSVAKVVARVYDRAASTEGSANRIARRDSRGASKRHGSFGLSLTPGPCATWTSSPSLLDPTMGPTGPESKPASRASRPPLGRASTEPLLRPSPQFVRPVAYLRMERAARVLQRRFSEYARRASSGRRWVQGVSDAVENAAERGEKVFR